MEIVERPDNLKHALAFVARGWPVFPACYPNGQGECGCRKSRKHLGNDIGKAPTPIPPHGFNDASTDEQVIQDWWGRDQEFNVAVNLGWAGLLAIDLDSPEAEIEAKGKGLPTTLIRVSRRPAYIYRRPDGCPPTRATGKGSSKKIDILSSGSLVFYGTNATGVPVYLENPDAEIAEAPQWAVDILIDADADRGEIEPGRLPDILPDTSDLKLPAELRLLISETGLPDRSKHCFRVAAALVKFGHPDEIIAAILLDRRHVISEKPREQGRRWTAYLIAKARAAARIPDPDAEALVGGILTWMDLQPWPGRSKATDHAVLCAHLAIVVEIGNTPEILVSSTVAVTPI